MGKVISIRTRVPVRRMKEALEQTQEIGEAWEFQNAARALVHACHDLMADPFDHNIREEARMRVEAVERRLENPADGWYRDSGGRWDDLP